MFLNWDKNRRDRGKGKVIFQFWECRAIFSLRRQWYRDVSVALGDSATSSAQSQRLSVRDKSAASEELKAIMWLVTCPSCKEPLVTKEASQRWHNRGGLPWVMSAPHNFHGPVATGKTPFSGGGGRVVMQTWALGSSQDLPNALASRWTQWMKSGLYNIDANQWQ